MELNVGDRVLVRHSPDKDVVEDVVQEQYGEWIRWLHAYHSWRKTEDAEIIGKLPKKESKASIRSSYIWATEGLDCPLLKKACNRNCAFHVQKNKSCIFLQLADDMNYIADDDD